MDWSLALVALALIGIAAVSSGSRGALFTPGTLLSPGNGTVPGVVVLQLEGGAFFATADGLTWYGA